MAKAAKTATKWGHRPTDKPAKPTVEEFVSGPEKAIRLNVLLPEELHRRVKVACAAKGVTMSHVVTKFLEKEFPKT
jgi:hypothetical protein